MAIQQRGLCRVRRQSSLCKKTCNKCTPDPPDVATATLAEERAVATPTQSPPEHFRVPRVRFESLPDWEKKPAAPKEFAMEARPQGCEMTPFAYRSKATSPAEILQGALDQLQAATEMPPCWTPILLRDQVRRQLLRDRLDLLGRATSKVAEAVCCAGGSVGIPAEVVATLLCSCCGIVLPPTPRS